MSTAPTPWSVAAPALGFVEASSMAPHATAAPETYLPNDATHLPQGAAHMDTDPNQNLPASCLDYEGERLKRVLYTDPQLHVAVSFTVGICVNHII